METFIIFYILKHNFSFYIRKITKYGFINKLLTIVFEINVYMFKMPSGALKIKNKY